MDRPLHDNDEALIRQLAADAKRRYDAIPADSNQSNARRSNLLIVIAHIGETLARRVFKIDTSKYIR